MKARTRRSPSLSHPALSIVAVVLLCVPVGPASARFYEDTPIVLELPGDEGDAWAVAIRSNDTATSFHGNELVVGVWTLPPFQASLSSGGIIELKRNGKGDLHLAKAGVGATIAGEDRILVEAIDTDSDPTSPMDEHLEVVHASSSDVISVIAERRFMEPGEWRYFVVWAAGADSSTFRVRGEGFEIRELVTGEAHALGTHELVNGNGVRVRQGVGLPSEASSGRGYVGAGATMVAGTGASLAFDNAPLGLFTEFHAKDACVSGICARTGNLIDEGLSALQEGGFANISWTDPDGELVWNRFNHYWFETGTHSMMHYRSSPGKHAFHVERLWDASGATYHDPFTSTGVRMEEEHLVLSVADVNIGPLQEADGERG